MLSLLCALGLGALLLALSDCRSSQHRPGREYYLSATNVKLHYWQQVAAGLAKAAAELGVRAEVVGPETYDPKAQHEQFIEALKRKPSGRSGIGQRPQFVDGGHQCRHQPRHPSHYRGLRCARKQTPDLYWNRQLQRPVSQAANKWPSGSNFGASSSSTPFPHRTSLRAHARL